MANASRDENRVTTVLGVSSVDSVTTLPLSVDPSTNALLISVANDSLSPTAATQDKRDQNRAPTVYGVSDTDGETLVPIRTDDNGNLLIELAS